MLIDGTIGGVGYGTVIGYDNVYAQDSWHSFSFKKDGSTTLKITDANNMSNELTSTDSHFDDLTSTSVSLSRWANVGNFYVDWIALRKYTFPEPSITVGVENAISPLLYITPQSNFQSKSKMQPILQVAL